MEKGKLQWGNCGKLFAKRGRCSLERFSARTESTPNHSCFCASAHGDSRFCEPLPLMVDEGKTWVVSIHLRYWINKSCCTNLILNQILNYNIIDNTDSLFIQVKSNNPQKFFAPRILGGYSAIDSIKHVTVHELKELVEDIACVNSKK